MSPGFRADLIVVDDNPLDSLAALGDVAMVLQEGRAVKVRAVERSHVRSGARSFAVPACKEIADLGEEGDIRGKGFVGRHLALGTALGDLVERDNHKKVDRRPRRRRM